MNTKKQTKLNYETRVALVLKRILLMGLPVPCKNAKSAVLNNNTITIKWNDQEIVITKEVNTEFSKAYFVYELRTTEGSKLYSVPMNDQIQDEDLHSSIGNFFQRHLKDSAIAFARSQQDKISAFQYHAENEMKNYLK